MRQLRPSASALVALVVAITAIPLGGGRVDAASTSDFVSRCNVNLRTSPSTDGSVLQVLDPQTTVTISGMVAGDAWDAGCVYDVSGFTWYRITAVGGQSVSSNLGVSAVYAATGLFRSATVAPYVEGIDVSRWQGTIDYAKVKAAGKGFVIAKATEGIGFTDPAYSRNRSDAQAAGVTFGAYHFARPDLNPTNPTGEADWYVDQLALSRGMLVPALDIERAGSIGVTALQNWVGSWLGRVYQRTGVRPMVYTSPSFWRKYLGDTSAFADQGYTVLWVAHWFVDKPSTPGNNWGNNGWTFWQYDDCGSVSGIGGCVDLDRFNGPDLTPVVAGADFGVDVPASVSVRQGGSVSIPISIPRAAYTMPIDLRVSGFPANMGAGAPLQVAGSSASLSITAAGSGVLTNVGSYPLTVSVSSGGKVRTATVTVKVTDGVAPAVSRPTYRLAEGVQMGWRTAPVVTSWSGSDPSGVAAYWFAHQASNGSWSYPRLDPPTKTAVRLWLPLGYDFADAVRATDGAGNTSDWARAPHAVPVIRQETSTAFRWSSGWGRVANSGASGSYLRYTRSYGAAASFTFYGSSVAWVGYRGPDRGLAKIYVDGVYLRTVTTYSSTYSPRAIIFSTSWAGNGTHSVRVVNLATSGHPRIDIDGFISLTLK